MSMADQRTAELPEGTDTVVEGANLGAITTDPNSPEEGDQTITIADTGESDSEAKNVPARSSGKSGDSGGTSETGLADRLRSGRERIASQAGDKARGLVSQGLERASETLANVARMVGDTAPGIDERLGEDYGDYARRAAGTIENVANAIAEKDPDELIDDTRNFVRNSPGVALAGAAVVGFVVARLLKSGLSRDENGDDRA
jgi:ElaB/YqjD/DUF883 family membrane-anchored ribosome-binding protein